MNSGTRNDSDNSGDGDDYDDGGCQLNNNVYTTPHYSR